MKKLLSVILVAALMLSLSISASASFYDDYYYGTGDAYYLNYPTQEQILAKAAELGVDLSARDTYAVDYSLASPDYVPGELSAESQQQALNTLNLYRYIAGLPDDVEIRDDYCKLAQAGTLCDAANDQLSHYPEMPEGMSDELYQLGSQGAGSSNIAWNYGTLSYAVAAGWMDDSDSYNIDRAGHRRWVLNPLMKYTGFGKTEGYTAMYSFDKSRDGYFADDYILWPAPNTPVELFYGSLFTVSLGADYDDPAADKVQVEVSSETLGESWSVSQDNPCKGFYVNNGGYGVPKCIIFKVADFSGEDTIRVKVNGITKNGVETPIEYTVNLFSTVQTNAKKLMVIRPGVPRPYVATATSAFNKTPSTIRWSSSNMSVATQYYQMSNGTKVYEWPIYSEEEGEALLTGTYSGGKTEMRVISSRADVLLGDADGDGDISIVDTTKIQRRLLDIAVPVFLDYAADGDENGDVDVRDATLIQRYLLDMNTKTRIGEVMQNFE